MASYIRADKFHRMDWSLYDPGSTIRKSQVRVINYEDIPEGGVSDGRWTLLFIINDIEWFYYIIQ